jgi:drug/metabolite transporter (DMT)-like permease
MFMAALYWVFFLAGGLDFDGLDIVWPGVLALGLVGPILSRMNYLLALRRIELTKVAVISQSQPVFVVLIAMSFLGQLPTLQEAIGGLVLTAGCVTMVAARKPRLKQPAGVPPN